MAINKAMRTALKALSYSNLDVRKTYKLERKLKTVTGKRRFYSTWNHQIYCNDHLVPIRLFFPPNNRPPQQILLFFHGGGWVTGTIDSYDKVCHRMARLTDCLVISVDYRLAPEYKFPAAPEDCYAVAHKIYNVALKEFGCSEKKITLIGDSAGANLAAVVSLMAKDRGDFMPRKQILIYPSTYNDHSSCSPFSSIRENGTDYLLTSKRLCEYMELYRSNIQDLKNPYYAPLLAENLSGQPQTLLITAEYDPLRDEGEAYGKRLQSFGCFVEIHRIPNALHGFFCLPPHFSHVKQCYQHINKFLQKGQLLYETS